MLTIEEARSWYPEADPTHGFSHILRVYHLCEELGTAEGADLEILRAAALLHDVELELTQRVDHHLGAAEFARSILSGKSWSLERIQAVEHCIRSHRFREQEEQPATQEAKILFDADKLDAIGSVGVVRALAYAFQQGENVYQLPSRTFLTTGQKEPGEPHTPTHEYHYKLSRLAGMMYTASGKRMARKRHRRMVDFFEGLHEELTTGASPASSVVE